MEHSSSLETSSIKERLSRSPSTSVLDGRKGRFCEISKTKLRIDHTYQRERINKKNHQGDRSELSVACIWGGYRWPSQ